MDHEEPCIFCAIAAGRAPCSLVYEDDLALAFMDTRPINPGHTLVITRAHYRSLADLDEAAGKHLFTVAQRIAGALRGSGVRCEGVNLYLADGEAASQEVFHIHLHVLPRYRGDGFKVQADPPATAERAALDQIALSIGSAYPRAWSEGR